LYEFEIEQRVKIQKTIKGQLAFVPNSVKSFDEVASFQICHHLGKLPSTYSGLGFNFRTHHSTAFSGKCFHNLNILVRIVEQRIFNVAKIQKKDWNIIQMCVF